MTDSDYFTPCITFLPQCVSDVNVSFKDVHNQVTKNFLNA